MAKLVVERILYDSQENPTGLVHRIVINTDDVFMAGEYGEHTQLSFRDKNITFNITMSFDAYSAIVCAEDAHLNAFAQIVRD